MFTRVVRFVACDKRIRCGLFALICVGAWVIGARGQSQNSCTKAVSCGIYSQWWADCIPVLPSTVYSCSGSDFTESCMVRLATCAPQPECPTCNKGGKPIDFATGDTYISETDVRLPGIGGGLTLSRTWNSIVFGGGSSIGLFGPNWTSNFEEKIFVGADGYMKYVRADGGVWSFGFGTWNSAGDPMFQVAGPASQIGSLTENVLQATPNWTLAFKNGETRAFDYFSGKLLSITDRNGNTTQLTYDASSRLATVTDPAGRHLYFSYASPSSFSVNGVSSDFGVSLTYSYDSQGRLAQVTKPDNTNISFQYDALSRISAVLDSNGKVLESHTYNSCGQGLTLSRAGGVESISVSYPASCQ